MGESPGIRYMRSSRKNHGPVVHLAPVSTGEGGGLPGLAFASLAALASRVCSGST